jgi:hypothetical protein
MLNWGAVDIILWMGVLCLVTWCVAISDLWPLLREVSHFFTHSPTHSLTHSLTHSSKRLTSLQIRFHSILSTKDLSVTWGFRLDVPPTACHFSPSVITLHASTTILSISGYYHGLIPFAAKILNGSELSQMVAIMRWIKLSLYKPRWDMGECRSPPFILNLSTAWKWLAWWRNGIILG